MRLSSIALCTLSAIVAGGFSVQASEAPNQVATPADAATNSLADAPITVSSIPSQAAKSVATPEVAAAQPVFSQTKESVVTEAAALTQPSQAEVAQSAQPGSETQPQTLAQTAAPAKPGCVKLAQANGTQQCPRPEPIQSLEVPEVTTQEASPALSIYIPVGYGADKNTVWISGDYQSDVRRDDFDAASFGVGVGLGDADKAVGLELSYALANNENFGEGGFNAKLHRRFSGDLGLALGWNGFLNIGRNDFEQSLYGVATKVFRLRESVNDPFSRLAVTVGVGSNQFRSNAAVRAGNNDVNVFGNVALRVARPVSLITEWTGQDLAVGLSIAPFRKFPLVITPAVRDLVTSEGRDPRFVLGAGMAFSF